MPANGPSRPSTRNRRIEEALVGPLQPNLIRALAACLRHHHQVLAVQILQAVAQHRAVDLSQQVRTNLNLRMRSDPKDPSVERRMMDFAQRQTVANHRFPAFDAIRNDMGGVQQFAMTKRAHCATRFVCAQNLRSEHRLVQATPGFGDHVAPEIFLDHTPAGSERTSHVWVDHKLVLLLLLRQDVDRVYRLPHRDSDPTPKNQISGNFRFMASRRATLT